MRELRSIRDKKSFKRRSPVRDRRLWFILSAVIVGTAILITITKVKTHPPDTRDLTPGEIYTKESRQEETHPPSQDGETSTTEESKSGDPAAPESFTFYKVLNNKEDIVPLEDMKKQGKKEKEEIKTLEDDKISRIEKEVDEKIEKKSPKNEIYAVQVAALGNESAAKEIVSRLTSQGYVPYVIKEGDQKGKGLYKIRIGKFHSIVDAQETAKVLKKDGYDTYVIKSE